jgi:hypothetical protein
MRESDRERGGRAASALRSIEIRFIQYAVGRKRRMIQRRRCGPLLTPTCI